MVIATLPMPRFNGAWPQTLNPREVHRTAHHRQKARRGICPMKVFDQQAEAVRCPERALVGIASRTKETAKIKRLPEGFKVVATDEGDQIYCAACNRLAITLIIDP